MSEEKNKGTMKNIYRHGDISLHQVNAAPEAEEKQQCEKYILAYGEATGHHHQLQGCCALLALNGRRWITVDEPTELTHQEHHTLTILPGTYEILEERTFDYFENSIKKVID